MQGIDTALALPCSVYMYSWINTVRDKDVVICLIKANSEVLKVNTENSVGYKIVKQWHNHSSRSHKSV